MVLEEIRKFVVQKNGVVQVCGDFESHDALLAEGYIRFRSVVNERPLRRAMRLDDRRFSPFDSELFSSVAAFAGSPAGTEPREPPGGQEAFEEECRRHLILSASPIGTTCG